MAVASMKVLIVGGGGREHALAWKVAQSRARHARVRRAGQCRHCARSQSRKRRDRLLDFRRAWPLSRAEPASVSRSSVPKCRWSRGHSRSLSMREGLPCFGPTRAAAQLEASKSFTKEFLVRHGIPTAAYRAFTDTGAAEATFVHAARRSSSKPTDSRPAKVWSSRAPSHEALDAVRGMLTGDAFGDAGRTVVIEECLTGEEASFICIADGRDVVPFASSQDHKTRDDGDRGPNTGRHGRLFAGAGDHAGNSRADHGGSDSPDDRRHGGGRQRRTSAFCTRD